MSNDVASSTGFVTVEGFNVNVTVRNDAPESYDKLVSMVQFTVRIWAYVARHITDGKRECKKPENAQELAQHTPQYNAAYCTVWGDVLPRHSLTVHSHTNPQDALDAFWARYDALINLGLLNPQQPEVTSGNDTQSGNNSSGELPDNVIIGKMNPSSAKVYYQNGQQVALPINRIKLTFRDGFIFEMWGTNGNGQYPAYKLFKTKKGKDENSDAYIAVKSTLEALALDLQGKSEAHGKWWLIGEINHVTQNDGGVKEYYNVIGIREQ